MAKVKMRCRCGVIYEAKESDLARGYGLSHDKSCAAKRRDFGGKAAKRVDGKPIIRTKKKPSTNRPNDYRRYVRNYTDEQIHEQALADIELGWDGHKNASF